MTQATRTESANTVLRSSGAYPRATRVISAPPVPDSRKAAAAAAAS